MLFFIDNQSIVHKNSFRLLLKKTIFGVDFLYEILYIIAELKIFERNSCIPHNYLQNPLQVISSIIF